MQIIIKYKAFNDHFIEFKYNKKYSFWTGDEYVDKHHTVYMDQLSVNDINSVKQIIIKIIFYQLSVLNYSAIKEVNDLLFQYYKLHNNHHHYYLSDKRGLFLTYGLYLYIIHNIFNAYVCIQMLYYMQLINMVLLMNICMKR